MIYTIIFFHLTPYSTLSASEAEIETRNLVKVTHSGSALYRNRLRDKGKAGDKADQESVSARDWFHSDPMGEALV